MMMMMGGIAPVGIPTYEINPPIVRNPFSDVPLDQQLTNANGTLTGGEAVLRPVNVVATLPALNSKDSLILQLKSRVESNYLQTQRLDFRLQTVLNHVAQGIRDIGEIQTDMNRFKYDQARTNEDIKQKLDKIAQRQAKMDDKLDCIMRSEAKISDLQDAIAYQMRGTK
jgi:chromosome segregation ATPase